MLNWDLLGPEYLAVEGVSSFIPTQVQTVPSAVNLVAARERTVDPDLTPKFHYFLSGAFCACVCGSPVSCLDLPRPVLQVFFLEFVCPEAKRPTRRLQ